MLERSHRGDVYVLEFLDLSFQSVSIPLLLTFMHTFYSCRCPNFCFAVGFVLFRPVEILYAFSNIWVSRGLSTAVKWFVLGRMEE